MKQRTALVFSGGGMFGAWQAGAWEILSTAIEPDLIVGASVGSLNGYAIAGGATPRDLRELWTQPSIGDLKQLPGTIQTLMAKFPLKTEFAVVLTQLPWLRPHIFRGPDVTWRHLAASCAIPGILPLRRINGRLYGDGGLQNPLPVWAATDLGATRIVALNVLAEIPPGPLRPIVKAFRYIGGYHPALPDGVRLTILKPEGSIGSALDAIRWKRANIDRWMKQGRADAARALDQSRGNISIENCLER